jgi:hypothetical protein
MGAGTTYEYSSYFYDDSPDTSVLKAECTAHGGVWFTP